MAWMDEIHSNGRRPREEEDVVRQVTKIPPGTIFVTCEAFSVDTRPCLSPTVHLLAQLVKGRIPRCVSRRAQTQRPAASWAECFT